MVLISDDNSAISAHILGDPEVTANIYCKSRNLPNSDTQKYKFAVTSGSPSIQFVFAVFTRYRS